MEGQPNVSEKREKEPGSYEYVLGLFQQLHSEGTKNPLDVDDPKVQEAQDALDEWERREGLVEGGVGTFERARLLVRSARMFLEAGFTGKEMRADCRERLDDLFADAQREGNAEVIAFLAGELESLEPKSRVERMIDAKLAEAVAARPIDAVGILSLALIDPRFKRMSVELRTRIEQAREAYKANI
ncbi:MAG: hypothetical protein IT406_02675 [Candidatus Yanofskybacteria bacterium]|nr:hypothetical protein [Candidatus Yanofskybacteria bacterium]